jgi:hypothetical protein
LTSREVGHRPGYLHLSTSLTIIVLALVATGCGRPSTNGADPTPTNIAQPTPDPTMAAVIQGRGVPVAYYPPLEVKGSPTPVPATARPASPPGGGRAAPKPAPTVREAAPALKPAPTTAPARPAPTAVRATNSGTTPTSSGGPGAAPAIINPTTLLPGSAVRPNPTPAR